MNVETEGIILKQVKTINGRRMVLLFSKKYGKISAGTLINEKGKSRAALAMRPFTFGKYDVNKTSATYHVNAAEAIKSYYKIGEDVEKYMSASYVLEFTEKILPESMPSVELFKLLTDFLDIIEVRTKKHMTVVIDYQLQAIKILGIAPELERCVCCESTDKCEYFCVEEGGLTCENCRNIIIKAGKLQLLYNVDFDIIATLKYFLRNDLKSIKNIALNDEILTKLKAIVKHYVAYHLGVEKLLSEEFLND